MSERARLRLVLVCSLGLAAVLMLGLPLLYLLLPNPGPVAVQDVSVAGRGVYLESGETVWRLFPRVDPLETLPADAPVVRGVERIRVVSRQAGALGEYRMMQVRKGEVAAEVSAAREGPWTVVTVRPRELDGGTYELVFPRESMFGGSDRVYFGISR